MAPNGPPPSLPPEPSPAAEAVRRKPPGWRFWIDRGGTFTDVVARPPVGPLIVRKVLSVQPEREGDPAVRALAELLGLAEGEPWPPGLVEEVRLGTTVATNALLEHASAPVLLLVASGLADLLRIGDQHRPELFALRIERPQPLDLQVVEVEGRLGANGEEVNPLMLDDALEARIRAVLAEGPRRLAVALPHSWREPAHERALGDWLTARGLGPALLSHQLSRQPRLLLRAATTVVEAALEPVLRRYLDQVEAALGPVPSQRPRLRVMTSSGALRSPALLRAKDTILSGPAGGMVGAVAAARQAGWGEATLLGFDMGGTSTDVFHFAPERGELAWERLSGTEVAGLPLLAELLPIHTVAAGGGSILRAVEGRLVVGPQSAGAAPGPACYRRGGPATITDANLLLGRLPLDALPAVFGPGGDQPADRQAVEQRFADLGAALGLAPEQVALGALRVAVERMAEAIRRISIQRGQDIRAAVLVSYGGAGGQHACALAERLGVGRVVLHPLAGVLSAWGIGLAPQRLDRERSLRLPLTPQAGAALRDGVAELVAEGRQKLVEAGDLPSDGAPLVTLRLDLRTAASEQVLEVAGDPLLAPEDEGWVEALRRSFAAEHARRFGHDPGDEELVVERLVVSLRAPEGEPPETDVPPAARAEAGERKGAGAAATSAPSPEATIPLCVADPQTPAGETARPLWLPVPLWRRSQLRPGQTLCGPAVVVEDTGTLVLEPGWTARALPGGTILLEAPPGETLLLQTPPTDEAPHPSTAPAIRGCPDPVRLELYNHRFTAIAEQMGVRLQQSSRSVNIRERLDFSCALFDRQGRLVANAPHIPVHLGAMGDSVMALLAACARGERPPLRPGEVVASNNPFNGGTHLPDVTVITPVFAVDGEDSHQPVAELVAFVANRGHHADVGGITPGSMPAFSRTIAEEGLLLDNVPVLEQGQWGEASWLERCAEGPWPVREPRRFLADLRAQVAANQLGVAELTRLLDREGQAEVLAYMEHGQRQAAEAVRGVIDHLRDGDHVVELDDGAVIAVAVRVDRGARRVRVDFTGTSAQQPNNLNAPLAITKAAVMYVFRTLVEEPLPLNAGCFEPIELVVPRGSLLWPESPAAVVAGNVETSQAVANALYGALGVLAA
ncbi:MAG: 5-oxoprolinase, partial [Cyanobacteria bacterium K_Offshore_surface_m2_239]|nr:5-oxoprolinase [Cyanobacteria bacterium K_Offshore_surface_m2_239]